MWPQWLRSPRKVHSAPNSPTSPKSPSQFTFSSFKDVQTLCKEEHGPERESPQHHTKRPPIFHRNRSSSAISFTRAHRNIGPSPLSSITFPNSTNQGIILYFTSLHVVRQTFEDCRSVRSILRGFRAPIDERDLSMDDDLRHELLEIMKLYNKKLTLPVVFIGGRYIGGAEEIEKLYDSGELEDLIDGLPYVDSIHCDQCGGLRFSLCEECNGSHKIYSDKWGFRTCTYCNANGLIRCPSCTPRNRRCSSWY